MTLVSYRTAVRGVTVADARNPRAMRYGRRFSIATKTSTYQDGASMPRPCMPSLARLPLHLGTRLANRRTLCLSPSWVIVEGRFSFDRRLVSLWTAVYLENLSNKYTFVRAVLIVRSDLTEQKKFVPTGSKSTYGLR